MKEITSNIATTKSGLSLKAELAIAQLEAIELCDISASQQDKLLNLSNKIAQKQLEKGTQISSPKQSRASIRDLLQKKQEEVMSVLFLDNKHRVISFEELFPWSISSAVVYTRVLIKRALFHNAGALILAHNHPSGVCEPSRADINITQQISQAMSLIEVRLLDHFIVSVEWIYSFAENGQIR